MLSKWNFEQSHGRRQEYLPAGCEARRKLADFFSIILEDDEVVPVDDFIIFL
jgi:hypothetical protein